MLDEVIDFLGREASMSVDRCVGILERVRQAEAAEDRSSDCLRPAGETTVGEPTLACETKKRDICSRNRVWAPGRAATSSRLARVVWRAGGCLNHGS